MIRIKITLGLFLLAFMTSCSFIVPVYIMNQTTDSVTLTLTLKDMADTTKLGLQYMSNADFKNEEKRDSMWRDTVNIIPYTVVNDRTVSLVIPAESTLYLTGGFNGAPRNFSKVQFQRRDRVLTLNEKEFIKKLAKLKYFTLFDTDRIFKIKKRTI